MSLLKDDDHSGELDAAFEAYTERVKAYGRRWWMRDHEAQKVLADAPALLDDLGDRAAAGEIIPTADVYRQADGWRDVRKPEHERVLSELFPAVVEMVTRPMIVYLMGLPGSGKSTVLRPLAERFLARRERGPVIVRDADAVRVRLPEFEHGLGSHVVQIETSDITYEQATTRLPSRTHLLVDIVGDPAWVPDEMAEFRAKGYAVAALVAEVPLELAVRRAKWRALGSGRHVPIAYLRGVADQPRKALDATLGVSGLLDHWAIVDTSGPPPGLVVAGDGAFGAPGAPPSDGSN